MKKYVVITYLISAIGGAQIYLYNKMRYCEKNGWNVYIFSAVGGNPLIEKLKKYENLRNKYFNEYPYLLSKRKVNKIIKWMLDEIDYNENDEIIIECNGIQHAIWGELLAKECGGKSIINYVSEGANLPNKSIYDFLEFKWKRNEFRCIKTKIMKDIFKDKNLSEEQCFDFRAPCTNSMEDVCIPIKLDLKPDEPVIGIVGRIAKGYVYATLKEVIKFANNHPDKFYNVLIVGGGNKVLCKKLEELYKNVKNIKVIITGAIYPVPQKLIEKMNVAIGSSGSIRLPWSLNIPSISVDLDSNKSMGFLGYDTQNTQFPLANEELKDISDCLEDYFYNSYLENHKGPYNSTELISEEEITEVLDTHFEYLELTEKKKGYFDRFVIDDFKSRLIKLAYSLGAYRLIKMLIKVKAFFFRI